MTRQAKSKQDLSLIFYVGTHRLVGLMTEKWSEGTRLLRTAEILSPEGFQNGEVAQLDKALASVGEIIKRLGLEERAFEIPAYVLLSNPHLKMTRFSSSIRYTGYPRVVTSREVRQVIAQTRDVAPLSLEDWILRVVPESFWVNDLTGVQDPVGLEAQRLAVLLQIFSVEYAAFRNLSRLFEALELKIEGYFPKTLVLPEAVLTESEREGEALLIDFSDGATHLVLTREGKMAQAKSLDFGSRLLTAKIAQTWQVGERDAGRLKEQFGSLEENLKFGEELIPLVERNGQASHSIRRSDFHQAFGGFAEEVFSRLNEEIRNFLVEGKAARPSLVLTGGGIRLEGLLEFLSRRLSFPVRLGTPRPIEGAGSFLMDPAWAGPLGFLRWLGASTVGGNQSPVKENFLARTLLQFKEWLVAYF